MTQHRVLAVSKRVELEDSDCRMAVASNDDDNGDGERKKRDGEQE